MGMVRIVMVGCGVVDCGVDGGTKEDGGLWDEV